MNQAGPATGDARDGGNPAGKVALGFGVGAALMGIVSQFVSTTLPLFLHKRGMPPDTFAWLFIPVSIAHWLLALVALVAGIMGLMKPGRPHGAAGAGTALGALMLVGGVISLLSTWAVFALT